MSGSFKDNSGQGVTLKIQNIQAGNDIYLDDISAMRCSVEDFRYHYYYVYYDIYIYIL
jgi:hypothetical protein